MNLHKLTEEQINNNKDRFLSLLDSVNRDGMNKQLLVRQLTNSDFFTAPASTKYHNSYVGGLCEHCLNVYDNLVKLNETFNYGLDNDSMIIVALLHDFEKMGKYKLDYKNVKVYSPSGKKRDQGGTYEWESEEAWKTKDAEERFIFSTHGVTSEYMTKTFIPLRVEESAAIIHHMGGLGYDENGGMKDIIPAVYEKYPLAIALHLADLIDSYNPSTRAI